MGRFVLALSCPDGPGIIRAVSGHLADAGCNVVDSQQFADPLTRRFFLRAEADPPAGLDLATLRGSFAAVGRHFGMDWALHDAADRPRLLILVSKAGHCLNDLLFRTHSGQLPIEVPLVLGNHAALEGLAGFYGVPFEHRGITSPATKALFEERIAPVVMVFIAVFGTFALLAVVADVVNPVKLF